MKNYASKITAVIVMTVFSLLFVFIFGELSDIITAVPVIKNIDYSYPSSEAPDPDGALTNPTPPKLIDVPYIYQDEHYPNGCESVSAVMALKYLGINITVDEFIDLYLDKAEAPTVGGIGEDPRQYYLGDPRSDYGWGCYSPVIATALHKILNSQEYTVSNSYGEPLSQLCRRYIDRYSGHRMGHYRYAKCRRRRIHCQMDHHKREGNSVQQETSLCTSYRLR